MTHRRPPPALARSLRAGLLVAACALGAASAQPLTADDFSPIPVGRDPGALRDHIALQRWPEAIASVTGVSPDAAFVRGWLQQKAGQHAAAVDSLVTAAASLPLLADLARITAAESLLTLGRAPEAGALAEPVATGVGPEARFARRVVARGLREEGKLDHARTVYQLVITEGHPEELPVALLGLARLEEDAGQPARALPLLKRIDLEFPAHWTGPRARAQAEALIAKDPKLKPEWEARSLDEHLARGERLAARMWFGTVISDLTPLAAQRLSDGQRCLHRYTLGQALRRRRQFQKALEAMDEAVTACEKVNHEKAPWARHLAGLLHERLAREESAAAHYQAQISRHPGHRLADDAGFYLIRHLIEDRKDLKAAETTLKDLVARFPAGDMLPEAVFWVFIEAFKTRQYKRARQILDLDARLTPEDGFRHRESGRVTYWQARLDALAGRHKAAEAGFRKVLTEAPLSWYAALAYSRLREKNRKAADAYAREVLRSLPGRPGYTAGDAVWQLTRPEGAAQTPFERARLLARLGLPEPAWEALQAARLTDTDAGRWLASVLLDRAGAHHLSHDLMRRQLWQFRWLAPHGAGAEQWRVAFPTPFAELVRAAGKAHSVDPHFIWGVMREESGFNPGIESHAAAIGLLQLILPTAKQMRAKGEDEVTRSTLTQPKVNIPLGARYLAHVKAYTKAQWALVPAGYNAGAGALSKWLKRDGHLPLDLFVELIPYEEARWYTKRVVSSWAVYRALYAGAKGDPLPYISQKTR